MKKIIMIFISCIFTVLTFSQPNKQNNISLNDAKKIASVIFSEAVKEDVNISLVILDKGGNIVLALKDDKAGLHTMPTAEKKAFTALTFGIPTSEFAKRVEKVPNLIQIDNVTSLGGGLPIKMGTEIIGSLGIGGAPSGALDEKLGIKGIEKLNSK